MKKKTLITLLKFLFSIGVVIFLVTRGKLDFSLIGKALQNPTGLILCLMLLATQITLGTYRWKKLVEIKATKPIPFFTVLRLTWIGLFFSSVLPGAVTGDIVKLVYARHIDPALNKTFLLTSILMDRVIGLIGLLCLLGLFSIFSYNGIVEAAPAMRGLLYFNFSMFIGVVVFLVSLFLPVPVQNHILNLTDLIPVLGKRVHKTLQQVWLIGQNKKTVALAFGFSIMAQFLNILAFWQLTYPYYESHIPLRYAFTFMPVGMMAMAIPITPAGLGVGHAIFGTLFSYFGTHNGASLFNLYFVTYVSVNLLGLVPYLLSDVRPKLDDGFTAEELS